jgi:hypothetical protein
MKNGRENRNGNEEEGWQEGQKETLIAQPEK